jgi:hypothetical protein
MINLILYLLYVIAGLTAFITIYKANKDITLTDMLVIIIGSLMFGVIFGTAVFLVHYGDTIIIKSPKKD